MGKRRLKRPKSFLLHSVTSRGNLLVRKDALLCSSRVWYQIGDFILFLFYLFIFGCVESSLLHMGFLFVAMRRLLIVVASLVAEHGL